MTAVPLGETPSLCVLCPPLRAKVARPGGMTDWDCHERLAETLVEIVNRYAKLSAVPGGGVGEGRRAPGYSSKPPLNIHVAALRDPRTAPETLGEAHSPLNLFITWARWMRRHRRQPRPLYPRDADGLMWLHLEAQYLLKSMDWITRQPWLPTFDEQVRAVVAQLRSANGEPNPKPVGTCRNSACGYPLFPPRGDDLNIRCGGCNAVYEPLDQIRMMQEAQGDQCSGCTHRDSQHNNDTEVRACNVQWCDCPQFRSREEE